MPNVINATSTGSGGLVSTGDDSGILNIQTNETTAITVDTSQNVGVGGTPTSAGPRKTLTVNGASGADFYLQYGGTEVLAIQATSATAPTINYPASGSLAFQNGTERMRIDSSGNVLVGATTPYSGTASNFTATTGVDIGSSSTATSKQLQFIRNGSTGTAGSIYATAGSFTNYCGMDLVIDNVGGGSQAGYLKFNTTSSATSAERMRITSGGSVLIAKTASSFSTAGFEYDGANKQLNLTTSGNSSLRINRTTNDGVLVSFQQDAAEEGTISVSGTTVSYNGGHLSRYAQTTTAKDESLVKGTVLSNLDAMNVYTAPTTYWTEEDELPKGVNVGDVKVETHEVANEQLNKVKVSDVEGDANVAGVFVNWTYDEAHQVDEINMAMTGDMIIRIAQGVTVQRGDLLMSAGDGTAKTQGDDIVRSKTIAKVTSNHVTCTYADGSYCVPCVLMAC